MFQPAEVPNEKAGSAGRSSSSEAWADSCCCRRRRTRRLRILGGRERRDHSSAGGSRYYCGLGRDSSTGALFSHRRRRRITSLLGGLGCRGQVGELRRHLRVGQCRLQLRLATAWALPPFGLVRLVRGQQRRGGRQEQCLGGECLGGGWRLRRQCARARARRQRRC